MDAPVYARSFLKLYACDRLRSCVRPLNCGFHTPRASMARSQIRSKSFARAQNTRPLAGFPVHVLVDRFPYPSLHFSHSGAVRFQRHIGDLDSRRQTVSFSLGHHSPNSPRHLIGKRNRRNNPRFSLQLVLQPAVGFPLVSVHAGDHTHSSYNQ